MLSLTDVVDHILPHGTRRVSGPPVTDTPVSRVALLTSDETPAVDRATFAIVAGPSVSAETTDLLSTAPAALLIAADHHVSDTTVDYPVLMLPPGVEPHGVMSAITGRLDEAQTRLAVQGIDIYRRLAELTMAGRGLAGIAAVVAELLALPVTLTDDEWRPLCSYGMDGTSLPEPAEHVIQGLRAQLRPLLEREHFSPTAPPVWRLTLPDEPHTYIVAPIALLTGPAGYVWADAAHAGLAPLVDITISHAAAVCAFEMARERAVLEAQLHLRGNFVEELLTDGYRSIEAMRQRARFLGHDLDQPHAVAMFDIDHFARYVAARPVSGEGAIVRLKERFMRRVADALADGDAALLWQQSDAVVALLPVRAGAATDEVVTRVERVRAMVQARLGGPAISAGVGRVYEDPVQLHRSYVEAREAVRIGLNTSGSGLTTPFDRLGVYRVLFRLRESPELEDFCDELLGPLERYDKARGADLVHTLDRYLANNCNIARATEELHLHRNGLLYRLQRIAEITGLDVNDARQRLSYHLALLARSLGES